MKSLFFFVAGAVSSLVVIYFIHTYSADEHSDHDEFYIVEQDENLGSLQFQYQNADDDYLVCIDNCNQEGGSMTNIGACQDTCASECNCTHGIETTDDRCWVQKKHQCQTPFSIAKNIRIYCEADVDCGDGEVCDSDNNRCQDVSLHECI